MQQIVYEIIDRCFNNETNNNNENNTVNSDITITPPLSTKNDSNNSNKDSQKDIKLLKRKIFFIDYYNINKKDIKIKKKPEKFLEKKRKRFFMIKKMNKKNKKILEIKQEIPKKNKIIFKNFIPEKKIENNKFIFDENNNNNKSTEKTKKNFLINIIKNNEKKSNKNAAIKSNENTNNIKIIKNDNLKNNINNNKNNKEKEVRKKKKKSSYTTEKELQIAFEKKFLENINKEYSDKEYEEDMKQCLKDKKKKFMKDNFPIMFQKDKFYLYSKLKKKRLSSKEYFIETEFFEKNKNEKNSEIVFNNYDTGFNFQKNDLNCCKNKIFKIFKTKKFNKKNNNKNLLVNNNNDNKQNNFLNNFESKEKLFLYPRKVWSFQKEKEINIDNFFDECTQIWPNDECCFTKEIALEFLMQNNYSIKYCLKNMDEFVFFMKKRAKELDFPIISESVKTIKKYHLRKTNYN